MVDGRGQGVGGREWFIAIFSKKFEGYKMSSEKIFCPDAMNESCPIYNNWVGRRRDSRMDVIYKESGRYNCLVLVALQDPVGEGGVGRSNEIELRIKHRDIHSVNCFKVELLNKLEETCGR